MKVQAGTAPVDVSTAISPLYLNQNFKYLKNLELLCPAFNQKLLKKQWTVIFAQEKVTSHKLWGETDGGFSKGCKNQVIKGKCDQTGGRVEERH